jgi:muramidase (phage lysozyme)
MTLTTESLRAWLGNPNYLAFAYALEEGEIPKPYRHTADAYRVLFGGELLDDLSRHPNRKVTAGGYTSTAAGRFQALWGTWSDFCRDISEDPQTLPFTAEWQDLFGVWCCNRRHALADIGAGRIHEAVKKCASEWASLPGSPYGQPTITMDQFLGAYTAAGGVIDNAELLSPVQPAAEPVAPAQPPEKPMPLPALALISAFGPMIAELIPAVAKAFDKTSETPAKIEAATKIVETVVAATGTANVQAAVEAMKADPAVLTVARNAVVTEPQIMGLLEIGGGIEAARAANLEVQNAPQGFWRNPAFWITLLLLTFPIMLLVDVFWVHAEQYNAELRTQIVTSILGVILVISGYWLGTSSGSARKTDIIAQQGASK